MTAEPKYEILIAEDHPIVVEGLRSFLSSDPLFHVVGHASNEQELYDLIETHHPNIVITEVKLPRSNIYRMIQKIQHIDNELNIIVLSNFTIANMVQDLMKSGVSAYLSKIASLEEIKQTIIKVAQKEKLISATVFQPDIKNNGDFNINNHFDRDSKQDMELTQRELEIILYLSRGFTNHEIAEQLHISKYTVETHRKNLMKKLNLKTSAQLIYHAVQNGLI
ncbi:MAG: response regulator transcription factor [Bacteroidota bacterium]